MVFDQGGIVVFSDGNLVIETLGGETRTFAVTANTEWNIPVVRVKAATTATVKIKECRFPG